MNSNKPITYFASPERSGAEELARHRKVFSGDNLHAALLNATADFLIVLNKNRQIVYANEAFNKLFHDSSDDKVIGKRPGEALNCQNAFDNLAGCGTSEFCRTCGAIHAILSSLNGTEDVQECRILIKNSTEALDLRVWTKPLDINGETFSVFTFADISNEKRRQALERIFFHDVLNTASAIKSFIKLVDSSTEKEKEELNKTASILINKLIEEIQFHRDLTLAESNELIINPQRCRTVELVSDAVLLYKNLPIAEGKTIEIDSGRADIYFISDVVLVSRILGNMLKNSLEASEKTDTIKIGCESFDDTVRFYVHNNGCMTKDVQAQIFQRSFSTKGKGRGLGTYSMKLLTEHYLKGKVYFTSSKEEGTTFYVELPLYLIN